MENKPFIHLFRTIDKKYVYDVNTNTILDVEKSIFDELKEIKAGEKETSEALEFYRSKGYLSSNRAKRIEHPDTKYFSSYIESKMNTVTLQVTQRCNLRCHYCAYSGNYENRAHNAMDMDLETAFKAIDLIIDNSSEAPKLNIGFYGGEPMIMFDFIKKCVEYAKKEAEGKEVAFRMTTNGTLLTDDKIDFLVENNFSILISIDGPKENHDKNRIFVNSGLGSYDTIMTNIEAMKKKYPDYVTKNIAFNAVLDGETDFKCASEFFNNYEVIKDFNVSLSLISEEYSVEAIKYSDLFNTQYQYERFKVYLNQLGKISEKGITKLFQREFASIKMDVADRKKAEKIFEVEHPGGPCIPCVRKMFISVDGTIYPCERVSELSEPMKLGNVSDGIINVEKAKAILNVGQITEKQCLDCWAYRFCKQCAAGADEIDELSATKRLSKCAAIKSSTEKELRMFCSLKELGYDFNNLQIQNINRKV